MQNVNKFDDNRLSLKSKASIFGDLKNSVKHQSKKWKNIQFNDSHHNNGTRSTVFSESATHKKSGKSSGAFLESESPFNCYRK
jgi:hypothetical protein